MPTTNSSRGGLWGLLFEQYNRVSYQLRTKTVGARHRHSVDVLELLY